MQCEKEEFIHPLDIFHKTMENKTIQTELEAWLTFLSTDDPEQIYNLVQIFPVLYQGDVRRYLPPLSKHRKGDGYVF